MTKFKVYFTTTVEQSIEVDVDPRSIDEDDEIMDVAIERAFDNLQSVPFIDWNFDASGDWEVVAAVNEDTGKDYDLRDNY